MDGLLTVVALLIVGTSASAFWVAERRRRRWLSYHVHTFKASRLSRKERYRKWAEGHAQKLRDAFSTEKSLITVPAIVSIIQLIPWGLVALSGQVGLVDQETLPWIQRWRDYLATLWQVHAAVLGLTFVVALFLVESIQRSEAGGELVEGAFRLYLRKSYMLPVAAVGLTAVLSIGILELLLTLFINFSAQALFLIRFNVTLFASSIVLTGFLYRNMIRLLSRSSRDAVIIEYVERQVDAAIDAEVNERIARRILEERADALGLVLLPGHAPAREDLVVIRQTPDSPEKVEDIDLISLGMFGKCLPGQITPAHGGRSSKGYLLKQPGSILSTFDDHLAAIRAEDYSKQAENLVRKSFKVRKI